ncbi:hypothetical protein [Nannocystis pusilla]|uniref:hypothetical protein n=1 Tax=Nannocystis pusilla TaxID=889268 RepID=UPI003B7F766C
MLVVAVTPSVVPDSLAVPLADSSRLVLPVGGGGLAVVSPVALVELVELAESVESPGFSPQPADCKASATTRVEGMRV